MSAVDPNDDGRWLSDPGARRVALATVGPHRVGGLDVLLRPPRLSDGPAWRAARLPEEGRLQDSFGEHDRGWADSCSLTSWVEHVLDQRRGTQAGTLLPFMAFTTDGRVLGECVFAVDPRSGAAECSLWSVRSAPAEVTTWVTVSAILRVLALVPRVPFLVAPIAVGNPGPGRLLDALGFEQVAVSRLLRPYAGVPTDHVVWRLENSPATHDRLAALRP